MIPKIMHSIWIGPLPCPQEMIDSWTKMNPGWKHWVWRDEKRCLTEAGVFDALPGWRNQALIDRMAEYNGKADVMRVEILERFGGVHIDADAWAETPLDDALLDHEAFITAENEDCRPGTLNGAFMGSVAGGAFIRECVKKIGARDPKVIAWKSVGPEFLTEIAKGHPELTVLPSGCFFPEHYDGTPGHGGPCYGRHVWGNTKGTYTQPEGVAAIICCKGSHAKFLRECVESVRAQTSSVSEIVVVCGDDEAAGTAALLTLDGWSLTITRDSGKGVAAARNVGVKASTAFSIFCLDADDKLDPTWLEKTKAKAQTARFIVGTSMRLFGDRDGVWHHPPLSELLTANAFGNCALFSRELYDAAGGYDETLPGFEDWEFWIRCARHRPRVAMVREPLLLYRCHPDQQTRREGFPLEYRENVMRRHPDICRSERPEEAAASWFPEILGLDSGGILMWLRQVVPMLPRDAMCVELGVFHGRSMLYLAWLLKQYAKDAATVHGVDPFEYYERSCEITIANSKKVVTWGKDGPQVMLHRASCRDVLSKFADASVGLLFVDDVHTKAHLSEDLRLWLPKMKPGGILSGHDYTDDFPGVKEAVTERLGVVEHSAGGIWWCRS